MPNRCFYYDNKYSVKSIKNERASFSEIVLKLMNYESLTT